MAAQGWLHGCGTPHLEGACTRLVLCRGLLDNLNDFGTRVPHFYFLLHPTNFVAGPATVGFFWVLTGKNRELPASPSPASSSSACPRPCLIRKMNYAHISQTSPSTWATQGNSSTQVSGPGSAPTSNFQGPLALDLCSAVPLGQQVG